MSANIFKDARHSLLVNKAIELGQVGPESYLVIPQGTTAELAAVPRQAGSIAYDTTLDSLVVDDGSGFAPPSVPEAYLGDMKADGSVPMTDTLSIIKSASAGEGGYLFLKNNASSVTGASAGIIFATESGSTFAGVREAVIQAVNVDGATGKTDIAFKTWDGGATSERFRIGNTSIQIAHVLLPYSAGAVGLGNSSVPFDTVYSYGLDARAGGAINLYDDNDVVKGSLAAGGTIDSQNMGTSISGRAGAVGILTYNATGDNPSGDVVIGTGTASMAGTSGNIKLYTNATAGTRGYIDMSAAFAKMPTGTGDPAGAPAGSIYFHTGTGKLRLNTDGAGTWVDLN